MSYAMRLATGEVLAGVDVHGSGGALRSATDGERRLRKAIERATAGQPLVGIYEPRPGRAAGGVVSGRADAYRKARASIEQPRKMTIDPPLIEATLPPLADLDAGAGWTERRIGTARRYDSTGGRLTVLRGSGAWTVFCWREAAPVGLRGQANGSRYFGADGAAAGRLALRAERLFARWGRR